ncbi:DKNYY domain-containing protein [Novipirellula sp.]|uniref:DKNYY domain-containing protein n=1 Tax=Novipirellula sp. TaxID=2795430 RepID=UPI003564B661
MPTPPHSGCWTKLGRFACDKDQVYYRAIKIEEADPDSFRRLKGDFSVDDKHAYN